MQLSLRRRSDQVAVPQNPNKHDLITPSLPCLYGCRGRTFQGIDQLFAHVTKEHRAALGTLDDDGARIRLEHAVK